MAREATQDNIGKILVAELGRDAIHVAVAPVEAASTLDPGQHVGLIGNGRAGDSDDPIGIVDPFLTAPVRRGQRFFIFLYPNTITSLRHEWTHPAFAAQEEDRPATASTAWLRQWADEFEMTYADLIDAGRRYLSGGDDYCLGFDTPDRAYREMSEFWTHSENVTGLKVADKAASFFRCAC